MKLVHTLTLRFSLLAAAVLAAWAVWFYVAMINEVNDEVDDSLEDYAELIIRRWLSGEPLPGASAGSNNQYFLRPVSAAYAAERPHITYADREVYIRPKREFEPARVITYVFRSDDGRYMEIEVSTPTIDKDDLRRAIAAWIGFLYVALLLTLTGANLWALRRGMRPLRGLLEWAAAYRPGRAQLPPEPHTRITELRRLSEALRHLTTRNEALFEQQKTFIGNASHEMQTPLAVCQNRIEMLLDDDTLTEGQMAELIKTRQALQRLARLNRSLLMLCKIENRQFAETAALEVGPLLRRQLADLSRALGHLHISTTVEERGPLRWEMNETLADVLLHNLLKNAFVHNRPGGRISITLSAGALRVANTGATDEPLDADRIWDRFYHTGGQGTGLGLALARAVAERYGLALTYTFEGGEHVFRVGRKT